ncbi:MAG: glycine cleavage system aminomethyltransferase GcvT [Proteobacteria bacterium]|nr:glycine cleavage system aminomethyltransferase GcvT [Pseudomonadota bacterium]
MGSKTVLYAKHLAAGGKIVDFGGWDMPLHYGSQIEEHNQVRSSAGMFDVSHMTIVDIEGDQAKPYLQRLLANDVNRLNSPGRALYSAMLNEQAGIIDDLIVYLTDDGYRLVVNCGTREKDLAWLQKQSNGFDVTIIERPELAIIAVQGPDSLRSLIKILDPEKAALVARLKTFQGLPVADWFIGRTGYTGEDGVEIVLPQEQAPELWQALMDAGVTPAGLGARDTLRLEAGLNLYGSDMDESITPLEANMAWTIAWEPEDRDFIGRSALEEIRTNKSQRYKLMGLVLTQRGVLRGHQKVITTQGDGEITSGTFSPTLGHSVAFAQVPVDAEENCQVEIRGKLIEVKMVKLPFVRHGKKVF